MSIDPLSSEGHASYGDRWEFTQREPDADTAPGYYRARCHDPAIGRWTSQDPVGFAAGDANLYRHVGDAPAEADDGSDRAPS